MASLVRWVGRGSVWMCTAISVSWRSVRTAASVARGECRARPKAFGGWRQSAGDGSGRVRGHGELLGGRARA
jgi:hypothetical protein